MQPTKEELEKLRDKGLTRPEIAEQYGVSISQVKRWISIYGMGKQPRKRRPLISAPVNRGEILHADHGMTLIELAKRVLGNRLAYCRTRGYLLDGRPRNVDFIIEAAGVSKVT